MIERAMLRAQPADSAPLDESAIDAADGNATDRRDLKRVVYVLVGAFQERVNDRIRTVLGLNLQNTEIRLVARGDGITTQSKPSAIGTQVGSSAHLPAADQVYAVPPYPNPLTVLRWVGLDRLRKKLSRYLLFPSGRVLYAYRVIRVLRRAMSADIKAGREVVLLTCLPPHDLTIVGLRIKQALPSVRWHIDWQDLWSYDENYLSRVPRCYRSRLLKTERAALESCDLNITTNHRALQILVERYGIAKQRVMAIPHHFQDQQSSELEPAFAPPQAEAAVAPRPLRLVFLGNLFKPPRVPGEKLMRACGELRKQHGIDLELHLYGRLPKHCAERPELIRDCGIVVHRRVAYERIAAELSGYDLLVLLLDDLPNCRVVMSIKLPQYLVAGPPILAMVPANSYIAEVIEETGTGYVVDTGSDWVRGLLSVLKPGNLAEGVSARNLAAINEYSWDTVSGTWEAVLTNECSER